MFVLERQKDTVETTDIGLRAAVIKSDPDLAMTAVGPADRLLDPSNFGLRGGSVVGSLLGFGTMLLTITGLYGLTSEFVARRTPELAVRLAIGSTAVGIGGLVFRDALTPVFHGLVLGAFLALCGGVLLRSLIPGVTAIDWSLGAACGLFQVGIAAVACLLPVLRAMRVQPSAVLRAQ
jgi:ABC-type antimicrobial peptide transport system permease subunit